MTEVSFERQALRLIIRGHAGGERGRDIVCAAESILLFTLSDWLYRREKLMGPMVYLGDGQAEIRCRPRGRRNEKRCREVMEAFVRGYELLGEKYPERVTVLGDGDNDIRPLDG